MIGPPTNSASSSSLIRPTKRASSSFFVFIRLRTGRFRAALLRLQIGGFWPWRLSLTETLKKITISKQKYRRNPPKNRQYMQIMQKVDGPKKVGHPILSTRTRQNAHITERYNVSYLFYPFWSLHYHWKGLLKKPPQSELQIFCACEPVWPLAFGLWGFRFLKFWKNTDQYITNMCWNEKMKSQKKVGYSESTQIWVDMKCLNSWKKCFQIFQKNPKKSQNRKMSDQKKIRAFHIHSNMSRHEMPKQKEKMFSNIPKKLKKYSAPK